LPRGLYAPRVRRRARWRNRLGQGAGAKVDTTRCGHILKRAGARAKGPLGPGGPKGACGRGFFLSRVRRSAGIPIIFCGGILESQGGPLPPRLAGQLGDFVDCPRDHCCCLVESQIAGGAVWGGRGGFNEQEGAGGGTLSDMGGGGLARQTSGLGGRVFRVGRALGRKTHTSAAMMVGGPDQLEAR